MPEIEVVLEEVRVRQDVGRDDFVLENAVVLE
jgi:hypothetical protein